MSSRLPQHHPADIAAMPDQPIERRACEIRLRAERKAGLLLKAIEKAKAPPGPGRGKKRRCSEGTAFSKSKTLKDLGISKKQSSRWQQLADVPEEQFEAALAGPEKPSTSGIIARAEIRMADELDEKPSAQGRRTDLVPNGNEVAPTIGELGLSRRKVHEWRQLRDAGGEPLVESIVKGALARARRRPAPSKEPNTALEPLRRA
jgi:hypothetical protein